MSKKELPQRAKVVIVGGGGHGLATAYYLAKEFGVTGSTNWPRAYATGSDGSSLQRRMKVSVAAFCSSRP